MSRVFISGGAGFFGSYTVRQLLDLNHEVLLYDSFLHYMHPMELTHLYNIQYRLRGILDKVNVVRGSTQDYDFLQRTIRQFKPTHIIHLAAMPLPKMAIEQPEEAARAIVQGTMNILQAVRDLDTLERFVYISSSMVYGDFQRVPCDEDHPTRPKEVYGGLKLSGEIFTRVYTKLYGVDHAIVRPSALYGPADNNRRVLDIFLENALRGKPLQVLGDETALDFTFVTDAAAGLVAATLHPAGRNQTFNLTRGQGRTILEAAEIITRLVPGTKIENLEADNKMPRRGVLDIAKATETIGFQPKVSLEEGLEIYLGYLKEQREYLEILKGKGDFDEGSFFRP